MTRDHLAAFVLYAGVALLVAGTVSMAFGAVAWVVVFDWHAFAADVLGLAASTAAFMAGNPIDGLFVGGYVTFMVGVILWLVGDTLVGAGG